MSTKGKNLSLVDKLVAKKKKKRELCLDLNTGKGLFIKKDENNDNYDLINSVLKIKKPANKIKKLEHNSVKEHTFFKLDDKINKEKEIPEKPKKIEKLKTTSLDNNSSHIQKIEKIDSENKNPKPQESFNNINQPNTITKQINNTVSSQKTNIKPLNITNLPKNNIKEKSTIHSNSKIIASTKNKFDKILEKQKYLKKKIDFQNNQISKLNKYQDEISYMKKVDDENKKLIDLEKKLKKIEKLKYLHQKKLSIEKYKNGLISLNTKRTMKNNAIVQHNNTLKASNKPIKVLPQMVVKEPQPKLVMKKIVTNNFYIDIINERLTKNNILFKKIINKYKKNLIPIKNIFKNNSELQNILKLKNIEKIIDIIVTPSSNNINLKIWHTLYNINSFNFIIEEIW